ncbi:histidine phosphatase family protein, partial [Streptomyces sp. NPDC057052]|uniref:histidine phosphatase family protein n=1 Tax=Streptomyces sp. NPDC057052 TaxID=3346010 RepID=UPI00363FDE7F
MRDLEAPATAARRTAPSRRRRRTAQALGWDAVVEPALRDLEMGHWRGRTRDEVAAGDGAGPAARMTGPEAAPHGGEPVADACGRVTAWLDGLPPDAGPVPAVVEQAVARAAVLRAPDAPLSSFWRVDVPAAVRGASHRPERPLEPADGCARRRGRRHGRLKPSAPASSPADRQWWA